MSNKRKNIAESLLPGLDSGGGYSPTKVIQPGVEEGKGGKFKRSGHLTDQLLKYDYPKDKNRQLNIFDALLDGTKKDIEVTGVEVTEIVEVLNSLPQRPK